MQIEHKKRRAPNKKSEKKKNRHIQCNCIYLSSKILNAEIETEKFNFKEKNRLPFILTCASEDPDE